MNVRSPEDAAVRTRLVDLASQTRVEDRDACIELAALSNGTALGGLRPQLAGRSVLIVMRTQIAAVVAAVELDGLVKRFVLAPPDLSAEHLRSVAEDAEADHIVTDHPERFAGNDRLSVVPLSLKIRNDPDPVTRAIDTEWILLTSGTSGRPKMVAHTLAALTNAVPPRASADRAVVWATFYDIRRYGGLQILLRAIVGGADIVLASLDEPLRDHLQRLGNAGVTSISGTPSHWRRVLMSRDRAGFAPSYVRLSGEIADQVVLDGLRAAFPQAKVGHAYASTEAGVGFAVDDGLEGFPADLIDRRAKGVEMKVEGGTLRIKSVGAATGYVGLKAPMLTDADGFVDTDDLVERRGDRYIFVGRRGGVINVGGLKVNPEEVEAVINGHADVRMSLVRGRKSPFTGALVVADVVLHDRAAADDMKKDEILALCGATLERHKTPAMLRFVSSLPLTAAGKLSRHHKDQVSVDA